MVFHPLLFLRVCLVLIQSLACSSMGVLVSVVLITLSGNRGTAELSPGNSLETVGYDCMGIAHFLFLLKKHEVL